jgi:hypothetical protein
LHAAATDANTAGYVIPPADLNPGLATEAASALSGKVKTAQEASSRNQKVTNALAKKALGLPDDATLDVDTLNALRTDAATSYQAIGGAGVIKPGPKYDAALDAAVAPYLSQAKSFPDRKMPAVVDDILSLKTPEFDSSDAVQTIRVIRAQSDKAYRSGDKLEGGALKSAATALEDAIEEHLQQSGKAGQDLLSQFRQGRQLIAKSYSVEKALAGPSPRPRGISQKPLNLSEKARRLGRSSMLPWVGSGQACKAPP